MINHEANFTFPISHLNFDIAFGGELEARSTMQDEMKNK
jgi:hypothetical protein